MSLQFQQFQQFPVRKLSKVLVKCGGDESAVLEIVEEFHRKRDISWCFFYLFHPHASLQKFTSLKLHVAGPFSWYDQFIYTPFLRKLGWILWFSSNDRLHY